MLFFGTLRLPGALLVATIGLSAPSTADRTPQELRGGILGSCPGLRSLSSECLKPWRMFGQLSSP
eukprot:3040432-Alexandrium_andersonii.AAC.1